jgi:hypothetical protein
LASGLRFGIFTKSAQLRKCRTIVSVGIARWGLGCHIFLGTTYQKGKNLPNNHKICHQNMPNGSKIYQMAIKIYQHLPLQDPPKFTQTGIVGFENITSGNPG